MKKVGMALLGTFLLMFVTGCGDDIFSSFKKDTLTCTSESSETEYLEESGKVIEQFIFEFDKDGIVSRAYAKQTFTFDDRISSSKKQTAIEDVKESCNGVHEGYISGTCKVSWKDPRQLSYQVEIDVSEADDFQGKTKSELKQEALESDYTCK